ncbi:hypothetical protein IWX47DRAFT_625902 [Phyllosticta citricarpa]
MDGGFLLAGWLAATKERISVAASSSLRGGNDERGTYIHTYIFMGVSVCLSVCLSFCKYIQARCAAARIIKAWCNGFISAASGWRFPLIFHCVACSARPPARLPAFPSLSAFLSQSLSTHPSTTSIHIPINIFSMFLPMYPCTHVRNVHTYLTTVQHRNLARHELLLLLPPPP